MVNQNSFYATNNIDKYNSKMTFFFDQTLLASELFTFG